MAYRAAMEEYVPPEPKVDEKAAAKQAKEEAKQAQKSAKEEERQAKQQAKEAEKATKDDARRAKTEAKEAAKAKGKGAKAKARARMPLRGSKARQPAPPAVELQAGVAARAEKEGLKEKLVQLASRQDVIDSKKTQTAMFKALQESGGLIHPARRALLGA